MGVGSEKYIISLLDIVSLGSVFLFSRLVVSGYSEKSKDAKDRLTWD